MLGIAATKNSSVKLLPNRIACLRYDIGLLELKSGAQRSESAATDEKSGGKTDDIMAYFHRFHEMDLMFLV
ncbi:MAG: hypothetical protein ACI84R_000895 [Candidatus Azotimanducaceae bacterium]